MRIKEKLIKGFSLIEIMMAIALSAILIPAFISSLHFSTFATSQGENFSMAYGLAQEQMEAIFHLKDQGGTDWDWENTPDENAPGEYYHLSRSGDKWTLENGPVETGSFTKKVEIKKIRRLPDGTISDSGYPYTTSRYVIVYVEWMENGQLQYVSLDSIVSKY